MTIERQALEAMDREGLLAEAYRHGVKRAEVMTRVELTDEILRLATPNPVERKEVRGWLGVARDLVASVVDKGLNLPDAAAVIRGDARFEPLKQRPHPPVATVTLAEIYGAQGHYARAIQMLDEVLEKEDDHHVARRLRDRLLLVSESRRGVPSVSDAAALADRAAPVPEPELPSSDPLDDDGLPEDEDLATLPPRADAAYVNGSPLGDEDGVLPTLPPRSPADEDGTSETLPVRAEDDEGTARTLPVALSVGEDDEDGTALTLAPTNGAAATIDEPVEEEPRTLAPEQLLGTQEPPRPSLSQLENPVRRVAPSDVDWEPLPQTEHAPNLAAPEVDPSAGDAAKHPDKGTDAVIVLRTGETTASLYFELASAPSHAAVLRVVELRPRRAFAERVERELPVTSKAGLVTIDDLERGSIVRAAIGVREGDLFRALSVAAEVRATATGPEVVWAPRKEADYGPVARNAALVLPQLRI